MFDKHRSATTNLIHTISHYQLHVTHEIQEYYHTPTNISLYNHIMSAEIGGVVFLLKLIEDCEIDPDSGNESLQEDDASQFTTKATNDSKDHDTSENIAD